MKSRFGFVAGVFSVMLLTISIETKSQSIVGTWQLVKQTTCLENEMPVETDSVEDMLYAMKSKSGVTPQIIRFKEKGAGEESTRILNKRRSANNQHFFYKFDNESLYILDKKSHTLVDVYIVDKFSADSLILSNSSQACETKVFLKIREPK